MPNVSGMCVSFRTELLNGSHAFGTQGANSTRSVTTKDVFKVALFATSANLGPSTTGYSTVGELFASGNYLPGGNVVTNDNAPAATSDTAFWTPSAKVVWTSFTSSAVFDAALLYNASSTAGLAVGVFTFNPQSIVAGTFELTMPTNDASTGLVRIGPVGP